jgi:predicted AAA+ superfamily ATPase
LLLGSASNALLKQSSESLAGRIAYTELGGFNLNETGRNERNRLWLNGGFPDAFLYSESSAQWREDFIRTYLARDIPSLGYTLSAITLRRFWTMLAHHQAQLFNASKLAANLDVSSPTTARYLDMMVDLMLVRRLQPWFSNIGKRLVKAPKTYIRDSGVLHSLLGISSFDQLLGHPVVGSSWEGFAIENILSVAPAHCRPWFYRTAAGAEIDLILEFPNGLWAIEIKHGTAPKLSRGFHEGCKDLQPVKALVVYAGDEQYPLSEGTSAIGLSDMMRLVADA